MLNKNIVKCEIKALSQLKKESVVLSHTYNIHLWISNEIQVRVNTIAVQISLFMFWWHSYVVMCVMWASKIGINPYIIDTL